MTGDASAGVVVFRCRQGAVEFLVVHPGGPYWRNKDEGAWSIPKGLIEPGEDPLTTALRELAEETGMISSPRGAVPLGSVRLASGKTVHAWAVEGDMDPADLVSNTFDMEWPPRSGTWVSFPEIDRVAWMPRDTASVALNQALVPLLDRLLDHLATSA